MTPLAGSRKDSPLKTTVPGTTCLALADSLPLTCTRAGTCCHGKNVWLNPWELARLADSTGTTAREFGDRYCEYGGIRLRFDGAPGWNNLPACSQYAPGHGCSVHAGRPLVCRLYPLGRERRSDRVEYIHHGKSFPCLDGCPQVMELPQLTVAEYLAGQDTADSESAHDEYLELMQLLADGAFALLIESGLAAQGDRLTLQLWRRLGRNTPEECANHLGPQWLERLMVPGCAGALGDPRTFAHQHHDLLQAHAQSSFGTLDDGAAVREASGVMMGLALHLGRGLGADPAELAEHWIVTARKHGARE